MVKKVNAKTRAVTMPVSTSVKNRLINNSGLIVYILIIIFASVLFISSLLIGGITWDEVYSLPTISTHFATAFNNIALLPNPEDQHLIYYGIINLMPGYLLYQIFDVYYICDHIASFSMGLLASYYLYKIALLFGIRRSIAYITGALLLLYPVWLGHSFFNDKDFPSAVFYTIYSYYVCRALYLFLENKKLEVSLLIRLIISGAFLAGAKFAFFPVIIVNSLLLIGFYPAKFTSRIFLFCKIVIITLLITILVTPGAWHQPVVYMQNNISLMSKFNWFGCSRLLNVCIAANSPQWSASRYLLSWYLVQTPLLFIILFIFGMLGVARVIINKADHTKIVWLVLFGQLLLIPVLIMLRNSTLYDATRHTLFCIPIIVTIAGFGLNYIYNLSSKLIKNIVLGIVGILLLILVIDDGLINPYQYSYFNEISRQYINDKNTDTDYWGFSLRETFNGIDMMKYYTPYVSMENGPMPSTLQPFMVGEYKFVHYDKNMLMPPNVSVNVIGLTRLDDIDSRINPERCVLEFATTRQLLFKSDRLIMSKAYHCS